MILKVNNKKFDFFNDVNVSMRYDAVASSFGFSAFFDAESDEHKRLFKPLTFSKVEIEHNGELIITGRKISNSYRSAAKPTPATISGYSLTGVLEDCTVPVSAYPLQFDGLTLKEIAEKLLAPFDIALVVDSAVTARANEVLDTSDASTTGSVKDYIVQLASQKAIIVTHTKYGALFLTEAKANRKPIADLSDAYEKSISINGQKLHSVVAVLKDADITGGNAGEAELDNPLVTSFRPSVGTQKSGSDNDTELAAKAKRGAELKGIKLTVKLDSWIINDRIIRPNNVISIKDAELYLYSRSNWFIEQVTLTGNEKSQTATLQCVLPEAYTYATPKNPFT